VRRACAAAALVSAFVSTAAAEPMSLRFPGQAPVPAPRTVRVSVDTSIATSTTGHVLSTALLVDVEGGRGGCAYGLQLGAMGWDDGYSRINDYHHRGFQPTNPVLGGACWVRPDAAHDGPFQIGLHVALMPGIAGGVDVDSDDGTHGKAPSQLTRMNALPTTVPDESAALFGIGARVDTARVVAQVEAAMVAVHGRRGTSSDTPNHGWFAAGVGVRVTPELAITGHALGQRGKRAYEPYEDLFALGGGAQLAVGRGTAGLHVERRLYTRDLGPWLPSDRLDENARGRCTRIVADYALRF
jgi:hypothetical protein